MRGWSVLRTEKHDTHKSLLGQGRTAAGACVDKLEELVTEGGMISNVDQCTIKRLG